MVREMNTGGSTMFPQVIRPLELLAAQPYEALPETEVRTLVRNLIHLRNEVLNVSLDTAPFWDAFLALSYQAIYTYRQTFLDKNDKSLESGIYDAAQLFVDYWILRLTTITSGTPLVTVTERVKLLEAVVNLTSPYGKAEISQLYQHLLQAKTPEEILPSEGTGKAAEEEKKEAKKLSSSHSVQAVPLVNVRNFISPLPQPPQQSLVDVGEGSVKAGSRFLEKYHKKIQRYLSEQLIGDKLLDILKDLPSFGALMESDVGAINYFKAVITRPVDARAMVGKMDFLRTDLDVAQSLSRLPLADCSSPSRLNILCSFGISCIANACKLLTSLNVVEAQPVLSGSDNIRDIEPDSVFEAHAPAIAKAETLMAIYDQLERSIAVSHSQAAGNMRLIAVRYFLSSLDGLLVASTSNDAPIPLSMPALFIVRQLLIFLSRITDEIVKSEETITSHVPLASELALLDTYSPWYRFVYIMRHHDVFSILMKTLALCHTQSFARLTTVNKTKDETKVSPIKATKLTRQGSSSSSSPPRSSNKKMSLSQDDLILGCLWDELNAEPSVKKVAETVKASVDAAFSEALLDTQLKLLGFLDRWFFDSENECAEVCVKEFFQAKHLTLMLPMMTSHSFEYVNVGEVEPVNVRSAVGTYVFNLDAFIHNLVTTRFVNDEVIVSFLKSSGLDLSPAKKHEAWPLYIPRTFLSFFGRVLLKWQFEQQDDGSAERPSTSTLASSATTTIWGRFCLTIQQRVLKEDATVSSPVPTWWKDHMQFEDVNAEHVYLLLLTFHGLALMQKKAVVTQLAATFVSCTCRTTHWTERSLLLVSRLLLILEYFMHKLYEPAEALLRQVDNLLFPSVPKQQRTPADQTLIPVYEMAQKVYDFSSSMGSSSRRVFYYAIAPELLHADPLTLDGLACSFLLALNKLPEYADLYQALSSLFNTLNTTAIDTQSASHSVEGGLYAVATVNYTALLLWRLLRILPPSLSHWDALKKDSQEFSLDSIQNMTTSLWLTRLHNKSYKTWLKDTFVKLGLTPINADLLLSNCADASGLVRDVQRAKNFMEAFLAKNKRPASSIAEVMPVQPNLPAIDASPTEDRPSTSGMTEQSSREVSFYGGSEHIEDLPTVLSSLSLVCLLCKMQQALDDAAPNVAPRTSEATVTFTGTGLTNHVTSSVTTVVPLLLDVLVQYGQFCTFSILQSVKKRLSDGPALSFEVYRRLVFLCGPSSSGNSVLRSVNRVAESLPSLLNEVLVEWDMKEAGNYPAFLSWKRTSDTAVTSSQKYSGEAAAYDNFVHSLVISHMTGTSNLKVGNATYHNLSLKYTVNMLVSFLSYLQPFLPAGSTEAGSMLSEKFKKALLPIVMGGCFGTQDVETATTILERVLGGNNFEQEYLKTLACFVYDILKLIRASLDSPERSLNEDLGMDPSLMSQRCIETLDAMMDNVAGRAALAQMFNEKGYDLTDILMSITKVHLSPAYHNAVLNFVGHVLNELLKHPDDKTMSRLGQSLSKIEQRSQSNLGMWMDRILQSGTWKSAGTSAKDPVAFLNLWVSFVQVADRSTSETLAEILLKALTTTLSSKDKSSNGYPALSELMPIVEVLASACKTGHEILLTAAVSWLKHALPELANRKWENELQENGQSDPLLSNVSCLMWYLERILSALRRDEGKRTASPEADDLFGDLASVLDDKNDEEESVHAGDESDDGVDDSNKLCTFTITAKEFMSQHWYHCHTCGLTNGQGMCSVCAQVCHKGHDVTYSKYGSFFCDCGAKEDGSCQALRKRSGFGASSSSMLMGKRQGAFSNTSLGSKSQTFIRPEGRKGSKDQQETNSQLQEQLNDQRDTLTKLLASLDVSGVLMSLTDVLCKGDDEKGTGDGLMQTLCNSAAGRSEKVVQKLESLHAVVRKDVAAEPDDSILQPLVATQERTFDNIKANLGEISEMSARSVAMQQNYVRRRVMAVFSHGATKYLAMVVEKSKVSVYQFSHLLKQVCDRHPVQGAGQSETHSGSSGNSTTTKLMLPCHGSVTVTFAISSIVVNPLREGIFVLTGAKDCVAVMMNPEIGTSDPIPVDVGPIDSSNFIVKAMWMADSQTELLVATLDFVKIFDLSKSVSKPVYNLLIANGKVRDVTMVYTSDAGPHVLIMSSTGQVFVQELTPVAAADMGPFFVTATLNLANAGLPRIVSREEEAGAGGLAVYYSHVLQLLFLSYSQGRLFVAPLKSLAGDNTVIPASAVTFAKGKGDPTQGLSLWNFSETGGYPGQVSAWLHGAAIPLILNVDSNKWTFQVIKNSNHKIKALDTVITRHTNNQAILASVNEDGTLKFFALNGEMVGSWSAVGLSSTGCRIALQGTPSKLREAASSKTDNPDFPVDFFEECTVLNSVEYGGDLVDVYPKTKLKTRLDQNAQYVISERTAGFTVDVQNNDHTHVICGVRIGVGAEGVDKIPAFVKVLGRTRSLATPRARYFDFPLAEEESLTVDGKISVYFAPSENGAVTYLDSLTLYGKSRASFGLDENAEAESHSDMRPGTSGLADMLLGRTLKALEMAVSIWSLDNAQLKSRIMEHIIEIISSAQTILPLTTHSANFLLYALQDFQTSQFHASKDAAVVRHAVKLLMTLLTKAQPDDSDRDTIDSFRFVQIISMLRPIAARRPASLYQHLMECVDEQQLEVKGGRATVLRKTLRGTGELGRNVQTKATVLLESLCNVFWGIHAAQPRKVAVATVVQLQDLLPVEVTVHALVDIIHAIMSTDPEMISLGVKLYSMFIGSKDQAVASAAKDAILKTLKPKDSRRYSTHQVPATNNATHKILPARLEKPAEDPQMELISSASHGRPDVGGEGEESDMEPEDSNEQHADHQEQLANQNMEEMLGELQMVWQMVEPHLGGAQLNQFIENPGNLQQILDIPPDADDEAMLDLAMALNMQPESDNGAQNENASVGVASSIQPQVGEESTGESSSEAENDGEGEGEDEPPSEDEDMDEEASSNHAADRRHSLNEQAVRVPLSDEGSNGSSLAGDTSLPPGSSHNNANTSISSASQTDLTVSGQQADGTLRKLRHAVIEQLQSMVPSLSDGVSAIPTMQILFNLCTDLDPAKYEEDHVLLDKVIQTVIRSLNMDREDKQSLADRRPENEVIILHLRFLSILISKSASRYRKYRPQQPISSSFTNYCAAVLNNTKVLDFCHYLLKLLLDRSNSKDAKKEGGKEETEKVKLLKPISMASPPDMAPFFLKAFVKSCGHDLFQDYVTLLTEMALRLPYQMKKVGDGERIVPPPNFESTWTNTLCEYMTFGPSYIDRRPPRKLLMALCGSKDKYRQVRDLHALECHIKEVRKLSRSTSDKAVAISSADLDYDQLTVLVEHLKACLEIAVQRTINWQRHCQKERSTLIFLMRLATALDEPVATTVLHLLLALFGLKDKTATAASQTSAPEDGPVVKAVVTVLNQTLEPSLLRKFVRCFLLQANTTSVRLLAHHFLFAYYRNCDPKYQDALIRIMWKLFEELPQYGYKAREFVDLLAYQTVKNPYLGETDWRAIIIAVIDMLKGQNAVMNHHPNARIYQQLADITGLDGFFLESDPCLVCNCPDVPTAVMKLSSIKVDAKYTSNSQLYKLSGTFIIDRINLKITELKRSKMVKCITVYYSNVAVDNIVELKNNMAAWKKAKSVWLTLGQAEVKIDFLLPIQATNLMIEYSEFYDNPQMTQETLQCPRCSTMVPAQPGICGNCGENVFQCLKCRSINYEHREPWMCHSCGFCKYGKFDYTVQCRPSSSGNFDPVVNEEQRRRTIATVDGLLTKCDTQYRTLQLHRNTIETMLSALQKNDKSFQVMAKGEVPTAAVGNATIAVSMPASAVNNAANVNPAIQAIAYRYSVECKNVVQSMVQHVQKITTCRKLLRSYDESQHHATPPSSPQDFPQDKLDNTFQPVQSTKRITSTARNCYGCASAASQLCVRILRVVAKVKHQHYFNGYTGLVNELIENHLHRGSSERRSEVKKLIISLMQGSQSSVVEFVTVLQQRISSIQTFCTLNPSIATSVGNEIALLEMDGGEENDRHWEIKLRCVVRLFLNAVHSNVPGILECIALPCLRIIVHSLKASAKGQRIESMSSLQVPERVSLPRVIRWLKGDSRNSFQAWTNHCPKKLTPSKNSKEIRQNYLLQKYALRWRQKVHHKTHAPTNTDVSLNEESWLKRLIFYPGSQQVRSLAVELLEVLLSSPSRRYYVDQFMGALLGDGQALSAAGEYASEFVEVVKKETEGKDSSFVFVASPDILMKVSELIKNEIEQLSVIETSERIENNVASNAQGYALKYLTSILGNLLSRTDVRAKYRGSLIGPVFNGYLSLRKLVMCRTKQVNEAEEKLLEIMESLTSGTEEETKSFMAICIEALSKSSDQNGRLTDWRTPQFIYERLCTIIFPQEKEKTEFSLVIEKDPQQEDYIQGRMQGNPYGLSAFVPRLDGPGTGGPTAGASGERDVIMRDIKNKICRDSELIGLLHDETAMELLVAGKIISLDLPVKSVYKKIWLRDNAEGSPMRVMYRLRGLMGDATEEFIGTLESRDKNNADPEEVYRLANVILRSNGFPVIIGHLRELCSASLPEQAAPLIDVILRLLSFAIQLKINRQALIVHAGEWQTFSTFITLLKMTVKQRPTLAHQLLTIMEAAFKEATTILSTKSYEDFVLNCGTQQDVADLLECLNSFEAESKTAEQLLHIIPFLCFGNESKLQVIVEYFQHCLDFEQFDTSAEEGSVCYDTKMLEWLCRLVEQLGQDEVAATFKDAWLQHLDPPLTKKIIAYFMSYAVVITTASPESSEFKRAVNRNSMKFVLRLLTGLARGHEATQVLLSQECVPSIHRLEHVSTPLSVLAENLMEVMKENGAVKERIEQIREQTKAEKKRLAMAMRAKQLGAMGMTSNEKGEILITKAAISGMEELADDKGLRCCICREGYRFKPDKLLGLYTFTYKQTVEPLEHKAPKTPGFITVTHFTSVHNECHNGAIKSNRDEWEKAALHNANTRCNGILPLWGPQVPESAYVQALARHNQHVQDFTGIREVNYTTSIHDIKLSLLTGAEERSFSEVSRGGGRDSNFRLLPYTIHSTLYVINSQRVVAKERASIQAFLKARPSSFRAQCHQSDSPAFYTVLFLLMHDRKQWLQDRLTFLQRLLVMSHEKRAINSGEVQEYSVYKSSFLFFALIDLCYSKLFAKVSPGQEPEGDWSETLAMYIRTNDIQLMEACDGMLQMFEEELVPATSAAEVMDILHLLDVVTDPHAFIQSALTVAFSPASDTM